MDNETQIRYFHMDGKMAGIEACFLNLNNKGFFRKTFIIFSNTRLLPYTLTIKLNNLQ